MPDPIPSTFTLIKRFVSNQISVATLIEDPEPKEDANNRILRSQAGRQSTKKDLTSVVDMLQKKGNEDINENLLDSNCEIGKSDSSVTLDVNQVLLEAIDSTSTAVYQTPTLSTVHTADLMKAQVRMGKDNRSYCINNQIPRFTDDRAAEDGRTQHCGSKSRR